MSAICTLDFFALLVFLQQICPSANAARFVIAKTYKAFLSLYIFAIRTDNITFAY